MYRGHDYMDPFFGLLFALLLGTALAAVVVGLLMLVRRGPGRSGQVTGWPAQRPGVQHQGPQQPQYQAPHPIAAAEQTLAERLARGEIDVVDYEQRLAALRRSRPAGPAGPAAPPASPPAPPGPPVPPTAD